VKTRGLALFVVTDGRSLASNEKVPDFQILIVDAP
jgi:hypothetical protein